MYKISRQIKQLKWRFTQTTQILRRGSYRECFFTIWRHLSQMLGCRGYFWRLIYSHLQKKYGAFIKENVSVNLRNYDEWKKRSTPNIIWWMWLQGEDNAPDICKACLRSLRRWHSDKKIITLNEDNIHEYITLPDYINDKYKKGIISPAHYSDLIRLQLLIEHGGTWIDATLFCTGRKFEYIMHLPFFLFRRTINGGITNAFIVSAPDNPILITLRDVLFRYWKDYNYCIEYFCFHMFFDMVSKEYPDMWSNIPFVKNINLYAMFNARYDDYTEEKMKRFREIIDFHKFTYKISPELRSSDKSVYHHIVYEE